jgi:hypothetical protein
MGVSLVLDLRILETGATTAVWPSVALAGAGNYDIAAGIVECRPGAGSQD